MFVYVFYHSSIFFVRILVKVKLFVKNCTQFACSRANTDDEMNVISYAYYIVHQNMWTNDWMRKKIVCFYFAVRFIIMLLCQRRQKPLSFTYTNESQRKRTDTLTFFFCIYFHHAYLVIVSAFFFFSFKWENCVGFTKKKCIKTKRQFICVYS